MLRILLLLIIAVSSLTGMLVAPVSAQVSADVYCGTEHSFRAANGIETRSNVYPWGVATRAQHTTQYTLNYRTERGFYDVPKDHPLYAELEKFYLWDIVPERCPHIVGLTDELTRGQLAQMIVKVGMYNNTIPGLVIPLTAPYSDIPLNHRYASTLHTLQVYGVIDAGTSFRPDAIATKIEAITMLTRAYKLKNNPYVTLPYQDIQNSWYTPYIQAAYSNGYLAPLPTLAPGKKLTKEDFFTVLSYFDKKHHIVIQRQNKQTVADRNAVVYGVGTTTPTKKPTTPTTPTTPTLTNNTITVRRTGAAQTTITAGSSGNILWSGTIANGYQRAQSIEQLSFSVIGLLPPQSVRRITATLDGATATGSLQNRTITFYDTLIIPARSTSTLTVQMEFTDQLTAADFQLSLNAASSFLIFDRPTITGSFPIQGMQARVVPGSALPKAIVSHYRTNAYTVQEQTDNVFLHTLRISSSDQYKDIRLQSLTLRMRGTMDLNAVRDLTLTDHFRGTVLASAPRLDGETVTFDLRGLADGGLVAKDGNDILIDLRASLRAANNDTISFVIDRSSDISVQDVESNTMLTVDPASFNNAVQPITVRKREVLSNNYWK